MQAGAGLVSTRTRAAASRTLRSTPAAMRAATSATAAATTGPDRRSIPITRPMRDDPYLEAAVNLIGLSPDLTDGRPLSQERAFPYEPVRSPPLWCRPALGCRGRPRPRSSCGAARGDRLADGVGFVGAVDAIKRR